MNLDYAPCRQIGQLLDNSSSQGSTQAWWNACRPSQGKMRMSSPSSKSTMQIGHVSRPIASGTMFGCIILSRDWPSSVFCLRGRGTAVASVSTTVEVPLSCAPCGLEAGSNGEAGGLCNRSSASIASRRTSSFTASVETLRGTSTIRPSFPCTDTSSSRRVLGYMPRATNPTGGSSVRDSKSASFVELLGYLGSPLP